jgi:peroxiredoxin
VGQREPVDVVVTAFRPVLVNFWATWCIPCRGEISDLVAAYQRFRDQGLVILAMSDERAGTLKRFAARAGVTYPLLLDHANQVKDHFHIEVIPQTLVYDRDGRLVAHAANRPTRDRLQEMLAQAGLR